MCTLTDKAYLEVLKFAYRKALHAPSLETPTRPRGAACMCNNASVVATVCLTFASLTTSGTRVLGVAPGLL